MNPGPAKTEDVSAETSKPTNGHLLVVEDSRLQGALLKQSLSEFGYSVDLAQDGVQALTLFKKKRPDLVISDVEMPGMGGYELCRSIKSSDPTVPVMLLTAYREVEDIIRGLEAGADNYLTKPCDKHYLGQRVHSLLTSAPLQLSGASECTDVLLNGKHYSIKTNNQQILNLLISTFENTVEQNRLLRRLADEQGRRSVLPRTESQGYWQNRLLRLANEQRAEALASLATRNQELELLNRQKNELLGMAAHDLRNPLGVVLGYSRFLLLTEMGESLNEEQRRVMATIERSTNLMLSLVNDLLDVSALESGAVHLNLAPTDMAEMVTNCIATAALLADDKEIKLQLQIQDVLPTVEVDSPKLEQVLINLLSNAIKFSHSGTVVRVSLTNQSEGMLLTVQDQGLGIPPEDQKKLFLPFSRTSVNTTAGESSTGLGLAIVKKIVESHGGRIGVESQVGKGSTFSVFIPWQKMAVR